MNKILSIIFLCAIVSCKSLQSNQSAQNNNISKWEQLTVGTEKYSGFLNYYFDENKGKIYMEVDKLNAEMIYVNYLSAGIGSNDIGLDRGKIGDAKIVKFQKIGKRLLLIQPNYAYRASTDNPSEERAIEEAFAQSIIHGFDIVAEQDWSVLVDATNFFISDAYGVAGILKRQKEGNYSFDRSRSAFNREGSRNFPENTELDCWITLSGNGTGREIRSVTPDAGHVTVRQHHSFVQLPDEDFMPRKFDIRAGYFQTSYQDYGVPIEEDLTQRFITRHRLKKNDPDAPLSEAVEPIIYYLDPGTPEPVRSALLEGAGWWNQAFEAAGYQNAFQIKMLPDDADPLDIRYNVIQWVHRSTRGWSYGMSVVDPRTGEIIKGHVSLGSLRVRQDYLIASGLLSPFKEGNNDPRMLEMSLARLRQLSAHEVGHTLGLAHNYIASTAGDASVMDYPHPNVKLNQDGEIDISNAYDSGIGEWDKVAIQYGYGQYNNGNIDDELNKVLSEAYAKGLRFISDRDARDPGGAHAQAHLWDNGTNAAMQLNDLLKVRSVALNQMDENVVASGKPLATIQEALIPIYFLHRYQIEAAVKMVGGMDYNYKLRGDNQDDMQILSAELQMQALNSLKNTIMPENLGLPEALLKKIHPRPIGYYNGRELLKNRTSINFDALNAAEQIAGFTFKLVLHPARLARIAEFNARDAQYPSVNAILNELMTTVFENESNSSTYFEAINRSVQFVYVQSLIKAELDKSNSPLVIASLHDHLNDIAKELSNNNSRSNQEAAMEQLISAEIKRFFDDPKQYTVTKAYDLPPGSPIGTCE